MPEYRAVFDATITFSNEGGLQAQRFRVDLPDPNVSHDDIARLFVTSLDLLMTESAVVSNVQIIEEPHKGTRGGPSDPRQRSILDHVGLRVREDFAPQAVVDGC